MPCSDGGYSDDSHLVKRADEATRAACEMKNILRKEGLFAGLSVETLRWIRRHEEEDRARERQEQEEAKRVERRRKALAKLSPADRKELDLE